MTKPTPCPCTKLEERSAIIQEACRVSRAEAERLARRQLAVMRTAEQLELGRDFSQSPRALR